MIISSLLLCALSKLTQSYYTPWVDWMELLFNISIPYQLSPHEKCNFLVNHEQVWQKIWFFSTIKGVQLHFISIVHQVTSSEIYKALQIANMSKIIFFVSIAVLVTVLVTRGSYYSHHFESFHFYFGSEGWISSTVLKKSLNSLPMSIQLLSRDNVRTASIMVWR